MPDTRTFDDSRIILSALMGDAGLMNGPGPLLREAPSIGAIEEVQDWVGPDPGFHTYYPSRRQVPTSLRLLIELIREMRPLGL